MLAFAVVISFTLPVFSEEELLFTIYSYSPNQTSKRIVKQRPTKKARQVKNRSTFASGTRTTKDESLDWEVPSVSLRSVIADKFILSNGDVSYDKSVIQSDLSLSFESGFYIALWNSTPLEKDEEGLGTELDYGFGWTGPFMGKTVMDIGLSYCDVPILGRMGAVEDMIYSYVKLSHNVGGINLYGAVENNIPTPESSYRGGSMISVGISKSDLYLDKNLNLYISLEPVYDTGNFGLKNGILVRGNVGFNWNVLENLIIVFPQANYYVPVKVHDGRTSNIAITSGFVYQF